MSRLRKILVWLFGNPPSAREELLNVGEFWCPRHWDIIKRSKNTRDPIDYHIATMGIGRYITLKTDHETEGPLRHACEMVPEEILIGVLERSKGWLPEG